MLFDVYGTVCDWHAPLTRALAEEFEQLDASELARTWRNGYARATSERGLTEAPWEPLVAITRSELRVTLASVGIEAPEPTLDRLNLAWRGLDPWPDTVAGLHALRGIAPIAPCSNGNFEDMAALAAYAGLPWTKLAGSEASGFYKPHRETYLASAAILGAEPGSALMVACHQGDLAQAQRHGLLTAFVVRPNEFGGPNNGEETEVTGDWDFVATDFLDLATKIGNHVTHGSEGQS